MVNKMSEIEWYSSGEKNDQWAAEVLDYKKEGYFIEIGACSGIRNSMCYSLEKYLDWNGIAVEPHSKYWKECKEIRKIPVNACIYDFDGEIDYLECEGKIPERGWVAEGLSGIPHHLAPHHKHYHDRFGKLVKKQCISPSTLLSTYNAPNQIDFLAIDVEGAELNILTAWPWEEYPVTLISVESGTEKSELMIEEYLATQNYSRVINPFAQVTWDACYCHNSFIDNYKYGRVTPD